MGERLGLTPDGTRTRGDLCPRTMLSGSVDGKLEFLLNRPKRILTKGRPG